MCWAPIPTSHPNSNSVRIEEGLHGGMVGGEERATAFFGNICLSRLLSVCHHSSLSGRQAAAGEDWCRRGREKRRLTSSYGLGFALAAGRQCEGTEERRKRQREPLQSRPRPPDRPTDRQGMVKPVSLAHRMDGVDLSPTQRQTDGLTPAARHRRRWRALRFNETARARGRR